MKFALSILALALCVIDTFAAAGIKVSALPPLTNAVTSTDLLIIDAHATGKSTNDTFNVPVQGLVDFFGGTNLWQLSVSGGATNLQPVNLTLPVIAGTNQFQVGLSAIGPLYYELGPGGATFLMPSGRNATFTDKSTGDFVEILPHFPEVLLSESGSGVSAQMEVASGILSFGTSGAEMRFSSGFTDGTTPFQFNTPLTHTTGNLIEVANNGTIVDATAAVSGWTGAGTKAKFDDGTYKTVTGGTFNPTTGFMPYNSGGAWGDSPWYRYATNQLGFGDSTVNEFWMQRWDDSFGIGKEALGFGGSLIGHGDIAIGQRSLQSIRAGDYNVGVGDFTLQHTTTGNYNVAIGAGAMALSSGSNTNSRNVLVGYGAGFPVTGDDNILIGYLASGTTANTRTNTIVIANAAHANVFATNSNEIVIGNPDNTAIYLPPQVYAGGVLLGGSTGTAGTVINTVASSGLLAVDSTKTNGIAATKAHITNAWGIFTGSTTSFVNGDGSLGTPAGGVTGLSNPSATIGLSAVNGSATTALRSDGAPALSQAIVPTWTGAHIFSTNAIFTNGVTIANGLVSSNTFRFGNRIAATLTNFPVANLQPVNTAMPMVLDLMPTTGALDSGVEGVCWIDLCNTNCVDSNPQILTARIGIFTNGLMQIGTKGFNGGSGGNVSLIVNGNSQYLVTASATTLSSTQTAFRPTSGNVCDLGINGAEFKNIWAVANILMHKDTNQVLFGASSDVGLVRNASGVLQVTDGTAANKAQIVSSGFGSYGVGTITTSATGATNTLASNQILYVTAATGASLTDNAGTTEFSGVTIAAFTPIRLQPGGKFVATGVTYATGTSSHTW